MKKVKISIIIIVIIIFILMCILLGLLKTYSKEVGIGDKLQDAPDIYENSGLEKVNLVNTKVNIELYLNRLLGFIKNKNSTGAYGLLYEEYIRKQNITEENIIDRLYKSLYNLSDEYILELSEVYVSRTTQNFVYIVKADIVEKIQIGKSNTKDIYVVLITDSTAFKIIPIDKNMYDNIKSGNRKEIENYHNVEIYESNYNNATSVKITDKKVMEDYIENYKFNLLYNPDKAYKLLEENYRNTTYGSIDKFKNEILKNINEIQNLKLTDIYSEYVDGVKIYYGKNKDKTYVIKEISIYEYNVSIK